MDIALLFRISRIKNWPVIAVFPHAAPQVVLKLQDVPCVDCLIGDALVLNYGVGHDEYMSLCFTI